MDVARQALRIRPVFPVLLGLAAIFPSGIGLSQSSKAKPSAAGQVVLPVEPLGLLQLKHVQWTSREGAPSVMLSMAETRDGFIWMASRDGLFRFDGLSFEAMDAGIDREKYGLPRRVLAARDGAVWIWYPSGWLAVYRAGQLRFIKAPETGGEVFKMVETRDGAIWLAIPQIARPMQRYHRGRWEAVAPSPDRDMLVDILEAPDGAVWLSYNQSVLRRPPGRDRFERLDVPSIRGAKLAVDADGAVWMAAPSGGRRLTGPGGKWPAPLSRLLAWKNDNPRWMGIQFDRSGNLWVLGRSFGRFPRLVQEEREGADSIAYEIGNIPRMTSQRPASLLIDRKGQIWYGGPRSLDRFSIPTVVPEPDLTDVASYGDALFTSSSGAVYIGQNTAVYKVDPGSRPRLLFPTASEVASICEDREGAIWVVMRDQIVRVQGEVRTTFPRPFSETGFYGCGADESGRLWLLASSSGLYWRDGAKWRVIRPDATKVFDPYLMWRDRQDRLWVLTEPNVLTRLDGGFAERRVIGPVRGIGGIVSLLAADGSFVISGENGAAFVGPRRVTRMADRQSKSLRVATGLAQTRQGDTWVFGRGLLRFRTSDLQKAVRDPNFVIPERVLNYDDGLPNGANAQANRSMTVGGDGRIWLATIDGPVWIDPAKVAPNADPPGVVITSLNSGRTVLKDPVDVKLPAGASDITIGFSALSLSMPERVKVLYRLEGHDADWVDPGRRRQAFYTNLGPGDYRFKVIAANEDGVWNRAGAEVTVSIPPTFLQSWLFKVLCGMVILGLGWIAYSVRVRVVANRIRMRMAERIGERERIARELHDTLLQSVQSLTLRFQLAVDEMPETSAGRPALSQAIDQADVVIAEGRDRVRDLRPLVHDASFEQELDEIIDRQAFEEGVEIRTHVGGTPRALDPLAFDELTRIASEAIFNVRRHSRARHVVVETDYGSRFRVRFIDDGIGIDPAIIEAGHRPGHFGLSGMRERTKKLKGRFVVRQRPEGGTELIVTVPGAIAYREGPRRLPSWLGFRRSKRGAGDY